MSALASGAMTFVPLDETQSRTAPVIELTDIHLTPVALNNFQGQITLVHFWATWCSPCLKEMPELQDLSETYRHKGLRVVAIAADSHEEVKKFLTKNNTKLDIMVDQYGSALRDYKVKAFPSSYLIDHNGELQFVAIGPVDWLSENTRKLIDNLIAKP